MQAYPYAPTDIQHLPAQPGVYYFYNDQKEIIYVGKAKHLRKRISSYFIQIQQHDRKTRKMVSEIQTIGFTIVNTEYEALLLENNLIKEKKPRYNILLKDGKTYPYLCITHERFPRVISTRRVDTKLGKYYGPFTNLRAMQQILELIKSLYKIRTCNYNLTEEKIQNHKFKVCLEYHIGRCKGPCEGLQSEEDYNQDIAQIAYVLKGNLNEIKKDFSTKMHQAAQKMEYELAQEYKEKLTALESYQAKSLVTNPQVGDLDVFGMITDEQVVFISYLQIKNGAIAFSQTLEIKKKLAESDSDILPLIILQCREKYESTAPEILINLPLTIDLAQTTLTVPRIGDKKKIVEIALKNALFLKKERFTRSHNLQPTTNKTLLLLQQDLQLKRLPLHIECFDNSNTKGNSPVAAMVVFKGGKPAKKAYRHFNIKTVVGPDDFASMYEVVHRRYQRLLGEEQPLPDLIMIDGGKGQLSAAVQSLKALNIYGQVPIIGIAKRLEEIYYPGDTYAVHINKKAPSLKLLQRIRNEAHRFALTFHRKKRSQTSLKSKLEDIPGIGPSSIQKLLTHFKSVQHIQTANLETLAEHVGHKRAEKLKMYLPIPQE